MKKFAGLVILSFQAFATDVYASPVMDLTIASDMAAVELSQLSQGSLWGVGLTRNDETRATVASITFNTVDNLASMNNVRAGVGWKALYHDTFQRAFSLAVGGSFRYEPANATGLGLEGQAYLAPQVLSTNDAERYHELMPRDFRPPRSSHDLCRLDRQNGQVRGWSASTGSRNCRRLYGWIRAYLLIE